MGRRTRGRDLWSGLALQGSFFVVPGSPVRVLWEVLWECLFKLGSSSHKVSGGLFQTYMDSHPLRISENHSQKLYPLKLTALQSVSGD